MDYRKYKLDAMPSPKDDRDFKISYLTSVPDEFPKAFRIPYNHPIKNQGEVGSCVGHAMAYAREITEELQHGRYVKLSPGFVYGNRVKYQDYFGEGMYPRTALLNTMNRGISEWELFPENDEFTVVHELFKKRWQSIYSNAIQYRYNAYALVMSESEIKTALIKIGAVMVVMAIHESFYKISKDNPIVPIPKTGEVDYGGHAMTIVGWREDNTWIVLNSWGEEWGDDGYCYLPFRYPVWECWSITDNILPPTNKEFEMEDDLAAKSSPYDRIIQYIVIHHPGDGIAPQVSIEKRWNPNKYQFPSYDYGIEHDGSVKVGRPLTYYGAHTRADKPLYASDMYWFNRNAIGVAVAGDFTKFSMPRSQYDSLVSFVKKLMAEHNVPIEKVIAHKEVAYTLCAGTTWDFIMFKEDLLKEESDTMQSAVVYWTPKDYSAAEQIASKLGNCGMFCRNANPVLHPDAQAAKQLIVVGGPEVTKHPRVKNLCGKTGADTLVLVGNYVKTL